MERQMTREEFVKQGLMLSEEDVIKFSHGYSSRVPYPKNELEFKEMIANAYLAGTELMVDFYLEHSKEMTVKEVKERIRRIIEK